MFVSRQEIGSDRKVCLSGCRSLYRCQTRSEWIGRLSRAPWGPFFVVSIGEKGRWQIHTAILNKCVWVCVCRNRSQVKLKPLSSHGAWGIRQRKPMGTQGTVIKSHFKRTHKVKVQLVQTSCHTYRHLRFTVHWVVQGCWERTCCVWSSAFFTFHRHPLFQATVLC